MPRSPAPCYKRRSWSGQRDGFLQDNKAVTAKAGSWPGSPAIQTFAISSGFLWLLVHELQMGEGELPVTHLTRDGARACTFVASETETRDSSCTSTCQSFRQGFRTHQLLRASAENSTNSQIRANTEQSEQNSPSRINTQGEANTGRGSSPSWVGQLL